MATFGHAVSFGSGAATATTDYMDVSKYTLTEAASVTKLTIELSAATQNAQALRGLIYSDSSGPSARLGVTEEAVTPGDSQHSWLDLPFAIPVVLSAGDYWLGFIGGPGGPGAVQVGVDATAGALTYQAETYSATPADPFGAPDGTVAGPIVIYATYNTTALYTILNGSDEQLLNVNAAGTDVDAATYKDGVELTDAELATLLSASFGKKNVAVLPDLTGVTDARQIKKTTFSAETESA